MIGGPPIAAPIGRLFDCHVDTTILFSGARVG